MRAEKEAPKVDKAAQEAAYKKYIESLDPIERKAMGLREGDPNKAERQPR